MIEYKSQNCKLFQNLKKSEEKHRFFVCKCKEIVKKTLKNKRDYGIISLVFKGVFIL